jgi:hypothetical protein
MTLISNRDGTEKKIHPLVYITIALAMVSSIHSLVLIVNFFFYTFIEEMKEFWAAHISSFVISIVAIILGFISSLRSKYIKSYKLSTIALVLALLSLLIAVSFFSVLVVGSIAQIFTH